MTGVLTAEFAFKGGKNSYPFPGIEADEEGAKAAEEQRGGDSAYVNGRRCIGRNNPAIDCHKGSGQGHYDDGLYIGLAQICGYREAGEALE